MKKVSSKENYLKLLARRPPVEETTSFLNSLLASHGPNYLGPILQNSISAEMYSD
jgi:hypothetical protein